MLYAPHGLVGAIEAGWQRSAQAARPAYAAPPRLRRGEPPTVEPVAGAGALGAERREAFGGVTALAGVSLDVAAGTTHAIVGPNGSGKTTLLNMISGFYPIDGGSILVDGRSVVGLSPHRIARRGVGRTFQTPRMLPELSVLDNALLGAFPAERQARLRRRCACRARGANRPRRSAMRWRYLDFVGLADRAHRAGRRAAARPAAAGRDRPRPGRAAAPAAA